MISYEPLKKILKEKSMNLTTLSEKVCGSTTSLYKQINHTKYINTDILEKICNTLSCNISDVIEWKDGAAEKRQYIHPDWQFIKASLNGKSYRGVSLAIHKNEDWLSAAISQDRQIFVNDYKNLCNYLGLIYDL